MSQLTHASAEKRSIVLKENAPAPLGCYSHAVKAGPFFYLCGLGARDPQTGQEVGITVDEKTGCVTAYDIRHQTRQVIQNLITVLEACNCTLADLVDVNVFLYTMDDFASFNAVYAEYFSFENPPTRTTVQAVPPGKNFIEIKAVAYKI